jgi:peroxiredoxin Q/BCP
VSTDSAGRHAAFTSSLGLPYPLVSDPKAEISRAYGVARAGGWLPTKRATFVIDTAGIVRRAVVAELDVATHAREALEAVREIAPAQPPE